ncbi:BTB/POZ protein [Ochromonadaceae sp. CCMP2298]|nr:BTB/POZ protein [Ochromonadaceae sp. CCMP2298]
MVRNPPTGSKPFALDLRTEQIRAEFRLFHHYSIISAMSTKSRQGLNSKEGTEGTEEAVAEVQLMEKEWEAAFYKASKSLNEKASTLIGDAKKKAELIVQDAEKKAAGIIERAVAETKKWEAEKIALFKVQLFLPIVKLDVGGVRFTTSLTTLVRFPDTMIGCMFSGRHALPKGDDGHFFIDRDGKHFQHILNFLRKPEAYKVEVTGAAVGELRRECEYYGIDELMVTEKSLLYHNAFGEAQGKIAVRVCCDGVHTIMETKEPIEYCNKCHRGLFTIGEVPYFFKGFNTQSLSAGQPEVQGSCPRCKR